MCVISVASAYSQTHWKIFLIFFSAISSFIMEIQLDSLAPDREIEFSIISKATIKIWTQA